MFGLVSRAEHRELKKQLASVQHALNLSLPDDPISSSDYVGSRYRSYKTQVQETSKKYEGSAKWGSQPTKNIIDLRATLTLGEGVEVLPVDDEAATSGKKELDFINKFIEDNKFAATTALAYAREAEIEGKIAIKISVKDPEKQTIAARFMPWTNYAYTVVTAPDDYTEYTKIEWESNATLTIAKSSLEPHEFVYAKFGGRTHMVNETPTKVGLVLTYLESMDQALRDWREINNLYASPTPFIKTETKEEAETAHTKLKDVNWKIGKLLVLGNAEFSMVTLDTAGIDALEKEIIRLVSIISGAVSIPVHFLGLPELMSNRATADNLMEVLLMGVSTERQIWTDLYTELFRKVLEMANKEFAEAEGQRVKFDPSKVKANIPETSLVKLAQLVDVWLELYNVDALSRKTFLEKVPGIDPDAEIERIKEQKEDETPPLPAIFGAAKPGGNGLGKPPVVEPPVEPVPAEK